MKKKVESILIVGGGSSGWMTAAAMVKQLPNIKVTVVESPNIPTIGVGESTLGHFNQYLDFIGVEDNDWMKHCNATYKTSIKFTDFRENPTEDPYTFHYPFGRYDFEDKPHGLMDWFIYKAKHPETPCENFAEFYHDAVLMTDANKLTHNKNGAIRNFHFKADTAYHLNAALFGKYLRDYICIPNGLEHIVATVQDAILDEHGYISTIQTDIGELSADLYIDCTGFKSVLLEGKMNVPFAPFHDTLLNDRAIATPLPYIDIEKEMECVTNCTAIEAGWVWNTPLWDRIGTGYVYSSKFASEDEALEQFKKHLTSNRMICPDQKRVDEAEFRHIKIKHGVHDRAWEKNVIGIGLSNGFIEPLESTGLMLTHEAILKVVTMIKTRGGTVTRYDTDCFNYSFNQQINGFKQFISLHYALSMRSDTPYWKHITQEMTFCPEMLGKNESSSQYANIALKTIAEKEFNHTMGGIPYISAGMGHNPTDSSRVDFIDSTALTRPQPYYWDKIYDTWVQHRRETLKIISRLPTHYQFLKKHIYT